MKFAASLLLLFAVSFSLTACNTLVTRRDMYSPKKGSGYWTDRLHEQGSHEGIFGVSNSDPRR